MRIAHALYVGTALSVLMSCGAFGQSLKAEVVHQWTSAGEAAAIKVFADRYTEAGGEWIDAATTGGDNLMAVEMSRITGGNPPTAMQFPLGDEMVALASQKLLRPLDDLAAKAGLDKVLPKVFLDVITYEGHIYAIPVNNHGQSWIWYNKAALEKAGATEPVTWDDFFAAGDKLKAAGIVPLAVGGQSWQLKITFNAVLATKGGAKLFNKVLGDRDTAALASPEFRQVVETFIRLRDYADEGNVNRDWNVATNMVITGQAGFNLMGDWAKGEFAAAGQTAGKEFGCVILGDDGATNFIMSADSFVFPTHSDDSQLAAQDLLASVMIDKTTQALFNAKKGSLPSRTDVDPSEVDACSQYGLKALSKPEQQLASGEFLGSGDFDGAASDLIGQFWIDKSMTVDDFIAQYTTILTTIP